MGARLVAACVATLLLWVMLLAGGLTSTASAAGSPGAAAVPAAPTSPEAASLTVSITAVTPTVLRPDETLAVTAEVTNNTPVDTQAQVDLSVLRYIMQSIDEVTSWSQGTLDDTGVTPTTVASQEVTIPAGESARVTLQTTADDLALRTATWAAGPRGIEVSAVPVPSATQDESVPTDDASPTADADPTPNAAPTATADPAVTRSFLLWLPDESTQSSPLAVGALVPVTDTGDDLAELASDTTDARLAHVVGATDGTAASLAVDPGLLARADGTSVGDVGSVLTALTTPTLATPTDTSTPTPSSGASASPSASAPAADASASTSPSASPAPTLSDEATQEWASRVRDLAARTETFALPLFDAPTETSAPETGATPVSPALADATAFADQWSNDLSLPWQSTPTATVAGTELAGYSTITNLLVNPGDAATPASAAQEVLATVAVLETSTASDARGALALTLPRNWDPDPLIAAAQLTALADSPWTEIVPLAELSAQVGAGSWELLADANSLATPDVDPRPVPGTQAEAAEATIGTIEDAAVMLPDPSLAVDAARDAYAWAQGLAAASDPAGRTSTLDQSAALSSALLGSVSVVPGSDVNLIAHSSAIPVAVRNSLAVPVTVRLRLSASAPLLQAKEEAVVTVDANSSETVSVPVNAVGTGNVTVSIDVLTMQDQRVAEPYSFAVRVRADWESIGTTIAVVALALLVTAGIWRTARRGVRRTQARKATRDGTTQ